jgi:transcriptional regulator GlxA family with amidase domain
LRPIVDDTGIRDAVLMSTSPDGQDTHIAVLLYEGFTALDFVGPLEVLARWPGARTDFVASTPTILSDLGLRVTRTATYQQVPRPDVLLVPGSSRPRTPLADRELLDWVRSAAADARWVASVCTGASILAAAGVLAGRPAATHWAFADALARLGSPYAGERYVVERPLATAAGVSAGIDMALALTLEELGPTHAAALQLAIEYDPRPPLSAGSPTGATEGIRALAKQLLTAAHEGPIPSHTAGGPVHEADDGSQDGRHRSGAEVSHWNA